MIDLNDIPQNINVNEILSFRKDGEVITLQGVSEAYFKSEEIAKAFVEGLHYADDNDVESGKPFYRNTLGYWVVRVKVGDFF